MNLYNAQTRYSKDYKIIVFSGDSIILSTESFAILFIQCLKRTMNVTVSASN